jgi:hypothetical protein
MGKPESASETRRGPIPPEPESQDDFDPEGPTPLQRHPAAPLSVRSFLASPSASPPKADEVIDELTREMFSLFIADDNIAALAFADALLERAPEHVFARLVAEHCRAALGWPAESNLPPQGGLPTPAPLLSGVRSSSSGSR